MKALKQKLEQKQSKSLLPEFFVPENVQKERYDICSNCDRLHKLLKTCQICHCVMPIKTKLPGASCPLSKWHKYNM